MEGSDVLVSRCCCRQSWKRSIFRTQEGDAIVDTGFWSIVARGWCLDDTHTQGFRRWAVDRIGQRAPAVAEVMARQSKTEEIDGDEKLNCEIRRDLPFTISNFLQLFPHVSSSAPSSLPVSTEKCQPISGG